MYGGPHPRFAFLFFMTRKNMQRGHLSFSEALVLVLVGASSVLVLMGYAGIAHATIGTNAASSLSTFGQTIRASSTPVAVIGLNLVSDSEKFASTSIAIIGSAGFTTADFASLSTATSSGIALYRDNKSVGTTGSFDAADVVVPLSSAAWTGATTTLSLTGNGEVVPVDNTGANAGSDYFIVLQTSGTAVNGHAFTANIYPGSIQWSASTPGGSPTTVTTNSITVDTVAPTLNANMTGPANNSTGVPVSTFIHFGFSENLDQTILNNSNVTLTT